MKIVYPRKYIQKSKIRLPRKLIRAKINPLKVINGNDKQGVLIMRILQNLNESLTSQVLMGK